MVLFRSITDTRFTFLAYYIGVLRTTCIAPMLALLGSGLSLALTDENA